MVRPGRFERPIRSHMTSSIGSMAWVEQTRPGLHGGALGEDQGLRSYVWEPGRGRRHWKDDLDAQLAVYANRRRIRGERGRRLQWMRARRILAHACCRASLLDQSSTINPVSPPNSETLRVTTIRPRATAMEAINRSRSPIGRPTRCSSKHRRAYPTPRRRDLGPGAHGGARPPRFQAQASQRFLSYLGHHVRGAFPCMRSRALAG